MTIIQIYEFRINTGSKTFPSKGTINENRMPILPRDMEVKNYGDEMDVSPTKLGRINRRQNDEYGDRACQDKLRVTG